MGGAGDMITAAKQTSTSSRTVGGRPALTYDNTQAGNWLTREQMANYFTAISGCADVIRAVNLNGIKIGPITPAFPQGAHTQQAKWFCKFIEGAATIEMAFQYDKAVLVYDTLPATDIYSTDFKTPAQQIAWGLKLLQQAIDSAKPTCATPPVAPCVPPRSHPDDLGEWVFIHELRHHQTRQRLQGTSPGVHDPYRRRLARGGQPWRLEQRHRICR